MKTYTSFKTVSKVSLSHQVYQEIKNAIITLELKPGEKIRDITLAESFDVSRTPIREALKQLELEGLVVSQPGSHTRISEIDEEEVKQSFVVVANLHALATKIAVPMMKEKDILALKEHHENFKQQIEKKNSLAAIQADDDFHHVFIRLAKNSKIDFCIDHLLPKIRRLEYLKFDSIRGQYSIEDHEKIIQLTLKGDAEQAAQTVEENWLSLSEQLI